MNYKIILEYDGSRYNGWQRQGNTDNTIQGKLEEILSKYFNQDIEIHGSGRTDAGVHALGQVANFKVYSSKFSAGALGQDNTVRVLGSNNYGRALASNSPDSALASNSSGNSLASNSLSSALVSNSSGSTLSSNIIVVTSDENILLDLNSFLPEDIRIISLESVDERFHARLNAKEKTYRYTFCLNNKRSVFERKYCALLPSISSNNNSSFEHFVPDIELMKSASLLLLGEHDFLGFSDTKTKKSTIRRIDNISFKLEDNNSCKYLVVDFTGNGFLYHTVRLLMGTLIQIGLHNCNPSIIDEILNTKDRKKVPYMAPAEGLTLVEVKY